MREIRQPPLPLLHPPLLRSALSSLVKTHAPRQSASDYPKRRHPLFFWPILFLCLARSKIQPVRSQTHRPPQRTVFPLPESRLLVRKTRRATVMDQEKGRTHLPLRKMLRKEFRGELHGGIVQTLLLAL